MISQVKVCNVCFLEKSMESFKKANENVDGRTRKCSQCFKDKLYTAEVLFKPKDGHKLCKMCAVEKEYSEFYFRLKDKGTLQPYCKPCHSIKSRLDSDKHRKKRTNSRVAYEKKRLKEDPIFKFKKYIRATVKRSAKKFESDGRMSPKAEEILGCTLKEFIEYIENQFEEGMTWKNHGHCKIGDCDVWNIDHKIPLVTAKTIEETLLLNHYTNLQPMWAEENLRKGTKILETYTNK